MVDAPISSYPNTADAIRAAIDDIRPMTDDWTNNWSGECTRHEVVMLVQKRLSKFIGKIEDALHGSVAQQESDLEQAFTAVCDELGCAYDNESPLIAIDNLKQRCGAPAQTESGCDIDSVSGTADDQGLFAQRGPEPVAWRWRNELGPEDCWTYSPRKPDAHPQYITEPLYTSSALTRSTAKTVDAQAWRDISTAPKDEPIIGWCIFPAGEAAREVCWLHTAFWAHGCIQNVTRWMPLPGGPSVISTEGDSHEG